MRGFVQPFQLAPEVLTRDFPVMAALTVVLFVMCVGRRGADQVTRTEGSMLVAMVAGHQGVLYAVHAG